MNDSQTVIVGIDLGTRFSCVSTWTNEGCQMIPDRSGVVLIPSVVRFIGHNILVGNDALIEPLDATATIYDIKRIIGRKISDPIVQGTRDLLAYKLGPDEKTNNILVKLIDPHTDVTKVSYTPEEICAHILRQLKEMVVDYSKSSNIEAVIAVPAYFNDNQRQATLDSAKIAGLGVIKLINEPIAAALAYGLECKNWVNKTSGNIMVYDLGAGTLDVSIIEVSAGVFQTLAVGGNSRLGGVDIDHLLVRYCQQCFEQIHHYTNIVVDVSKLAILKSAVEVAKKILSTSKKTFVCVDHFYNEHQLYVQINRKTLNNLCASFYEECLKPLDELLESAHLTRADIDDVVLVGGSTRIPAIGKHLLRYFRNTRLQSLNKNLHPDRVVAIGAALYGRTITSKKENANTDLLLLDVTPLSLGVETLDHQMNVIIPRNTIFPTEQSKLYTTTEENQLCAPIKIFEGERGLTADNTHLGTFSLTGLKSKRGLPTIKIIFKIDNNGILQVSAIEEGSGVKNEICLNTVDARGRLTPSQIEQLVNEANTYRAIDGQLCDKVNCIHSIKKMCHSILNNLDSDVCTDCLRQMVVHTLNWVKEGIQLPLNDLQAKQKKLHEECTRLVVHTIERDNICAQPTNNDALNDITPFTNTGSELDSVKNTILELCQNITSIVNNPASKLENEDKNGIIDYLSHIISWVYSSPGNIDECRCKINEINDYVNGIMERYPHPFSEPQLSKINQLKYTCLTLLQSIQSSYLPLSTEECTILRIEVQNTYNWLLTNENETDDVYLSKLAHIDNLCNEMTRTK